MLARAVLLGIRAGAHETLPVVRSNTSACTKAATGGSVAWKAPTRGFSLSASPSSAASSTTSGGHRRRLLDDLLSRNTNGQGFRNGNHNRSAGLAALLAGGTVAAAAGAFYVVSSAKEKKNSKGGPVGEEDKSSFLPSSSPSSSSSSSSSPPTAAASGGHCSSSPCAQPGAAPAAAPVDRAALLADLRAWLEAAGADIADVDIRPCEGNSAGVGVFVTASRRSRGQSAGSGGGDDGGALATARAVASSLGRRLNPFGRGGGRGGGGAERANDSTLSSDTATAFDPSSSSSSSPSSPTVVLASFPLSLAVTPAAALADEATGAHYARLLAAGQLADERALVMLFLAVERARGRSSRWAQWIAALPREFSTPLHFSDEKLELLGGTTLGKAAASLRARLAAAWARLAPAAAEVAAAAGVATPPTLDDFKWAYSTFWSRGMAVPWPVIVGGGAGAPGAAGAAGAGTAADAAPAPPAASVAVEVVECILPGLDFCNHAPGATTRWTLWGAGGGGGNGAGAGEEGQNARSNPSIAVPDRVALVAPAASAPRAGDELLIDYGDKSQEELLLLYGFAHATSAATGGRMPGVLMVPCPLPAAPPPPVSSSRINGGGGGKRDAASSSSSSSSLHPQTLGGWDADLEDRLELLRRRGLAPQVFLPVSGPAEGDEAARGDGAAASSSRRSWLGGLLWPFSSPAPSPAPRTPASFLPPGVWDTLEAFVLEPEVVRAALAHPDAVTPPRGRPKSDGSSGGGDGDKASSSSSSSPHRFTPSVENAGLRMAVLTTLSRLLEGTVLTLEGPGGTGPLEADVKWLQQEEEEAKERASEGGGGNGGSTSSSSTSSDAAIRRACVEYRATQKAAARRWLARARRAVDEQVRELEELMAAEE